MTGSAAEASVETGRVSSASGRSVSFHPSVSTFGRIVSDQDDNGTSRFRFENKNALSEDLGFLSTMPEICDVTFLVGDDKQPVCGVKAILAARSRVFRKTLFRDKDPLSRSLSSKQRLKSPTTAEAPPELAAGGRCIAVTEFDPLVFKQLMEYIHTGCCTMQAQTLPGLMNAADHYGIEELKRACVGFVDSCIGTDTVCSLLNTAENYIQYKSTKLLVGKILEYIDKHGEEVLALAAFVTLPQHVVTLILGREELKASELTKFNAAHMWAVACCRNNPEMTLKEAMSPLVNGIAFYKIAAIKLMREIRPLNVVPDEKIMLALAYHADPNSVDLAQLNPRQLRTSTGSAPLVHPALEHLPREDSV